MRYTEKELPYEEEKKYRFAMYAEFADGFSAYIYDREEDGCISVIAILQDEHGKSTFYTGVTNEYRTDGEWTGSRE